MSTEQSQMKVQSKLRMSKSTKIENKNGGNFSIKLIKPIIANEIFFTFEAVSPAPPWPLQAECVVYGLLEQAVEDTFQ